MTRGEIDIVKKVHFEKVKKIKVGLFLRIQTIYHNFNVKIQMIKKLKQIVDF